VRDGCPEERVDGIADVLLDGTAVRRDDRAQLGERRAELALEALGAEARRQLGRPDDVDEHARHEAPFLAYWRHGRESREGLAAASGRAGSEVTSSGRVALAFLDRDAHGGYAQIR
jgi:hypothetical protein